MAAWKGLLVRGGKIEKSATSSDDLKFDPVTATASELRSRLDGGSLTSVDLVQTYLLQISAYNHKLHAVIQTAPRDLLLKRAVALDAERNNGKPCGPLHGIPILVKDNIDTHPSLGMGTTCGSFALLHAKPKANAPLVDGLINAGAIILGKVNLSEFAYLFGEGLPCGWSAVGGQTHSAYVNPGFDAGEAVGGHSNCGGSSSGSAVAVSAGFAPISIGSETSGSLIMPANRAALYTMKPTIGMISQKGMIPASSYCDSAGPMTKSVVDFANALDALIDPQMVKHVPSGGYASALTSSWSGIRIGCLSPDLWRASEDIVGKDDAFDTQWRSEVLEAYEKLKKVGAQVVNPVELVSLKKLAFNGGNALFDTWKGSFRDLMDSYLTTLDESPVRSLKDITEFNTSYEHFQLPPGINQNFLLGALESKWTEGESAEAMKHCRKVGRDEGIDYTLRSHGIDVIIGPADSDLDEIIAAAGYPAATLPLSTFTGNGRPFGLVAIAGAYQEAMLVKVMSAWEATFPARAVPSLEHLHD